MSALLFLSSDDFTVRKGTKGNILCHRIPNFSLILFYSTKCPHCKNIIPIFKGLPGTIDGCQFGMINVSTNKKTVMDSRETIAPISCVPYIMLFYNGKPHMRYQGPYDMREISRFVIEVTKKIRVSKKSVTKNVVAPPEKNIPEYTIGVPLYGDGNENVCYFDFSDAYEKEKKSKQQYQQKRRKRLLPEQAGMRR